jgi:hypothetical protein
VGFNSFGIVSHKAGRVYPLFLFLRLRGMI